VKAVQIQQIHRLSPLASAIALAVLTPVCMAQAQQETKPAETAQAQPETAKLEAVVVTSNKRKEKLMEVPAAITVLDNATLERSSAKGMDDLSALSPALTISYSTQPGNYSINMRGIGTFSFGIGVESDVSVIVDDIPIAFQAGAFKDIADVARVEVLKGPQSTLFGKSAIAGALNITTKPIQDQWKTTASALLTNDGENRLGVSASGALNDHFRMRVAASSTSFDGTVKNLTNNTSQNGNKEKTLLGKFEWTPSETVTVTLSPHYNHTVMNCCVQPLTSMTPGGQWGLPPVLPGSPALPANLLLGGIQIGPGNVSVRNDYPTGGTFHDYGSGLKVDYAPEGDSFLAGHILSSITSYDKYHMNDYQDGDGTDWSVMPYVVPNGPYTGGLIQYGSNDVKSVTQEFRITSPDKQRLRYVAGLWYGKNNLARALRREPVQPYSVDFSTNAYNTTYAVYGQGTFDVTDSTSLVAGLRLNREDTGFTLTKNANPPAAPTQTGYWFMDNSEKSVTGRVGLEHRLNKDVMVYGMYSTGRKGLAYDLTSGFSDAQFKNQPVPGEKAKNFEVGMKAMLLDNRAAISVALFKTNFFGFQQSAGRIDDDGVFRTQLHSIGELQTSGVEVDGSFRVSKAFLLNGSFAYMRAIMAEFPNGPCYNVLNATGTGQVPSPVCAPNPAFGPGVFQDLAGKQLPNAPKIKANFGGQYDIALPGQSFDLFANGAYRWQSATQFSLNQDPGTIQTAYGILDAGFGIKDKQDAYKFSFFVKNLLDKRYAAGLANSPRDSRWSTSTVNVTTTAWTPPRDYTRYFGARLDLSF
jgi:iron complex outermembrane receptor protein